MTIFFMVLSITGKDQFLIVGFKCLSSNRLLHGSVKSITPTLIKPKKPFNYKQAVEIARDWGRPLLIIFTDHNCPWCVKLLNETLQDSRVKSFIEPYILFHVQWQRNQYLCLKYNIVSYPSYKVVDVSESQESVFRHGSGYRNPDDFIAWISS